MTDLLDQPKQRVIQEYVPGKQITLAHVIASPHRGILAKLGLDDQGWRRHRHPDHHAQRGRHHRRRHRHQGRRRGHRLSGPSFRRPLVLTGDVASIEAALAAVLAYFGDVLRYAAVDMTRT